VDRESIAVVEAYGAERLIGELQKRLEHNRYRPMAVLRRYIPKPDGRKRPLGIPAVRDRIVQMAAKLILEPVFEADFQDCSYGFRPKRSATDALEAIRRRANKEGHVVLDADIRDYFGSIDHKLLMKLLEWRVSDRRVLKLVRRWLKNGVLEDGLLHRVTAGVPQGGVISPLLSNIYLNALDITWKRNYSHLGTLVRYADDFVVICDKIGQCREAKRAIEGILAKLRLSLHPEKTRMINLWSGLQGFDFLGCHVRRRLSGALWQRQGRRVYYLHRWPSTRSMNRLRERLRKITERRRNAGRDITLVVKEINPILRGWGNYFRTGNATNRFIRMDGFVWMRLRRLIRYKYGRNLKKRHFRRMNPEFFYSLGLHRLRGTVQYPQPSRVYQENPSVSRVRENRTHGSKGSFVQMSLNGKGV
jgi:group II intron reverse transcriptase/maturase